jgi:NAD(P)-dependent dehydrogenase (short-subunit alcohol dehydrogenase family)
MARKLLLYRCNSNYILIHYRHGLAPPEHQFSLEDCPDLSEKVAVITGGSEGIGYGAAHTLLKHNLSKLFIIGVSQEVFDGAKQDISEKISPEAAEKVTFIQCDLADWPAVTKAAKKITDSTDRLDILINNSGRGVMTFQLTEYGVDRHMAISHFGHVILTSHLLPLLKRTSEKGHTVRIANQASNLHQGAPSGVKFESIDELNTDYGPNGQYGRSKLAVMLWTRWLNKHLSKEYPKIIVNCTHPGFVETKMSVADIHEPYPIMGYGNSVLLNPLKKDQWEGCVSILYAGVAADKGGQYICPPAIPEPGSSQSQDEALGEQLMKLTEQVIKEKMPPGAVDEELSTKFY